MVFAEPRGQRNADAQHLLKPALDLDLAIDIGLAQPRDVAGEKMARQPGRVELDRDPRFGCELERFSVPKDQSQRSGSFAKRAKPGKKPVAAASGRHDANGQAERKSRLRKKTTLAAAALERSIERHPHIPGQRQTAMGFAQTSEPLGELREGRPTRQLEAEFRVWKTAVARFGFCADFFITGPLELNSRQVNCPAGGIFP